MPTCPKCGRKDMTVLSNGKAICKNYKCWDSTPGIPTLVEGGMPPFPAQVCAIGTEVSAALDRLIPFAVTAYNAEGREDADALWAVVMYVLLDVLYLKFTENQPEHLHPAIADWLISQSQITAAQVIQDKLKNMPEDTTEEPSGKNVTRH